LRDRRAEHGADRAAGRLQRAGDLGKELAWMHAHTSFSGVQLVAGTQPFNPSLTQAIIGG